MKATHIVLWLIMVVAPALSLFMPETFAPSAPQVFGWIVTATAFVAVVAGSFELYEARNGKDPDRMIKAADRIIERYLEGKNHKLSRAQAIPRAFLAVSLYVALGFGWLAFMLSLAVLAVAAVSISSRKFAKRLIDNGGYRPGSGVGEGASRDEYQGFSKA